MKSLEHLRRLLEVARLDLDYASLHLSTAHRRLSEAQPGFPSGGDGGSGSDGGSIVERLALSPDQARTDLQSLEDQIRRLRATTSELVSTVGRWSKGLAGDPVAERKAAVDDIWCPHLARFQIFEPRREGGRWSRWVDDFQRSTGQLPPKAICEMHARGIRITDAVLARHGIKMIEEARRG